MDLPVFEMVINPEEGSDVEVSFVALVDKPAIERNFLTFKDQRLSFAVDQEKRIISGPAMVSDQLIYRKDQGGEYNVFFSPQTVRDIAVKFFKKDYQKNLNLFHDPSLNLEGVTIFESFVTDKARGIQPMRGFEDLPDGSWFISAKVENDEVWNKIKSGEVKGFSVEGIFSFMKVQNRPLSQNSLLSKESSFMSDLNALKDTLKGIKDLFIGDMSAPAPNAAAPQQLAQEYQTKDGKVLTVDRLEVGGVCMEGQVPVAPGEYEFADGTKVTVGEGGVISMVTPAVAPQEAPVLQESDKYTEQFTQINEKLTTYETKFSEQATQLQGFAEKFEKAEKSIVGLLDLVGKILETPTADSVTGNKAGFSTQKTETKNQRLADLADALGKLKTK